MSQRSPFAVGIGRNLCRARKRVGLSQEETAVLAELHRTAVGQLERGERVARADTLVKLASALSASPADLLAGLTWRSGRYEPGGFELSDPECQGS